jgi:hypothetical protein
MKILRPLGAVLFAVLAVGTMAVASASAVTFLLAEWLLSGNAVTAQLPSEATGELLLEDLLGNLNMTGAVGVLCIGKLDGNVNANGADEVTEVLNAAGELIGAPLSGLALECPEDAGGTAGCTSPLVWPVNLPWRTLAELMVDGTEEFFVDLLLAGTHGNPGWEVECMTIIPISDTCTAIEGISHLVNLAEDVGAEFKESFTELAGLKLATCERGGAEQGVVESDTEGLITVAGGTLSVSS